MLVPIRNLLFLLVSLAVAGCSNTGTVVRLEMRSSSGITTVDFADYTFPVLSISSGPSLYVWQTRNGNCETAIGGSCIATNSTDACGIYHSSEHKAMKFDGKIRSKPENEADSP